MSSSIWQDVRTTPLQSKSGLSTLTSEGSGILIDPNARRAAERYLGSVKERKDDLPPLGPVACCWRRVFVMSRIDWSTCHAAARAAASPLLDVNPRLIGRKTPAAGPSPQPVYRFGRRDRY